VSKFTCTSIVFLSIIFTFSCINTNTANSETTSALIFEGDPRPEFVQNIPGDYYFCVPWSYRNPSNIGKKYPLFVYLHGSGSSGEPLILPCLLSDTDKKTYPSFVYLPHASGGWNNAKLISQIETLLSLYPEIDADRIYLMGYSMGGSGSFALANDYYDSKGRLFAAIVRMAGQSQTSLRIAINNRTSIWYHVGLSDTPERVNVARDTYGLLKAYSGNISAQETISTVPIQSYPGITKTLTKGGIEIVKYTEYNSPVGHGISNLPLLDPLLLKWLYSQSLSKR